MEAIETQEIMPNIFSIKNTFVNLYLFKSEDKYIAFDSGADADATKAALEQLNVNPNDVIAVFLTHTHYDHVAALSLFASADVYIAKSNQNSIANSKRFANLSKGYKTLSDGETVNIENANIQCIFTPGHTNGSATYILENLENLENKYLFAGDNFSLKDGKVGLFNSVFNASDSEQRKSITKISKLDYIEAIFTMHYGYITDFKTAFSEWLE